MGSFAIIASGGGEVAVTVRTGCWFGCRWGGVPMTGASEFWLSRCFHSVWGRLV